jgi:hypothetical protein
VFDFDQSRSIAEISLLRGAKRTACGPARDRALEKDLARFTSIFTLYGMD